MTIPILALFAARHCAKAAATRLLNLQIKTLHGQKVGPPDLNRIKTVEIDHGRFKYLLFLIKEDPEENPDTKGKVKTIVRGYSDCEWHMNIYERVTDSCDMLGFKLKCAGGGEIIRDANRKQIIIFGRSEKYGVADHYTTKNLLHAKYPDYHIDVCDNVKMTI